MAELVGESQLIQLESTIERGMNLGGFANCAEERISY
jgi:hypothetical protein